MTNQLSKNLICVCMRNGVEIWMEAERAGNLINMLEGQNAPQFIRYEERLINKADLVGIFTASDMDNLTRRKNGGWQCLHGQWHGKTEKCTCISKLERERNTRVENAINNCTKCDESGYVIDDGVASACACWIKL